MPRVLSKPVEKGITIGTAYGWGAALGGLERLNATVAGAVEFAGAIGGLIGAMTLPPGWDDVCEGIASGSGALLGLGLTAPTATARKVQARGELGAKNKVDTLLLKEGGAAKDIAASAVLGRARVGAGLE